jgi:glycosyltransferase involved in cell wall biosynthesis
LRARGVDTHLVVHERDKAELTELFAAECDRLYFVEDTILHRWLARTWNFLPRRLAESTIGLIIHLTTQCAQKRIIRTLAAGHKSVVHLPIPVSPKAPSLIYGVGAPVIMGPLNGGMEYPPAFRSEQGRIANSAEGFGRWFSKFVNAMFPGKGRAALILVANSRTEQALPSGILGRVFIRGRLFQLPENGVDLSVWNGERTRPETDTVRFVFVGRLVDWKAIDILLEAFQRVQAEARVSLDIIGDGPERENWKARAEKLGIGSAVHFHGFLPQPECAHRLLQSNVFVLPSLFECGGAVVLEAMAMGLPVIATAWGGPTDYLDATCSILIKPSSRQDLVAGFASAMTILAKSADLRDQLGSAAYKRGREKFSWEKKIDKVIELYEEVIKHAQKN